MRRADASDASLLERVVAGAGGAGGAAGAGDEAREGSREAALPGGVLLRLLDHPDVEVHLALAPGDHAEEVVGLVVLRRGLVVLPAPAPVLHVEQLWVVPAWRRRGVGHQLLSAAVGAAEAAGAEEVTAVASSGERDVQRFLARLGFGRPAVHRSAPVPVLRARLAAAAASAGGGRLRRRAALDQLVARRRRQLGVGAGPGPAGAASGSGAASTGAPDAAAVVVAVSAAERPAAGT